MRDALRITALLTLSVLLVLPALAAMRVEAPAVDSIEEQARIEFERSLASGETSRVAESNELRSVSEGSSHGTYRCLPSCSAVDGRFLAVAAGASLVTLSEPDLDIQLGVAAGTTTFELGIFDGDANSFNQNWDVGTSLFSYTLFNDPNRDGTGMTVAAGPFLSTALPNNAWFDVTVATSPAAQAPSGNYFYRLAIENVPPLGVVLNSFKVRSTGVTTIEVQQQPFGFYAAIQSFSDAQIIYPNFPGSLTPTTYDGTFDFYLDVVSEEPDLVIWGGDLDRGAFNGTDLDTDDPDTPNAPFLPPWATFDTLPEGAKGIGSPADDNSVAAFVRSPSIEFSVIAPDGGVYDNTNPSGNQEWEQFRLTTDPLVDVPNEADELVPALPAGTYRINARGVDMQNLNFWRFFHPLLCIDEAGEPCTALRSFLIGDLVWRDDDGNGVQNGAEPGIEGVVVELFDDDGDVIQTTTTDANGAYSFEVDAGEYTVHIAESNFEPGGVLEGYASTTGGEVQDSTIVDDNDLERDFGYRATGSIGNYVWYDENADGVDNEPSGSGIGGVTIRLTEAGPDGMFDTPDDVDYGTQTTDGAGAYDFTNLPPGTYRVDVVDSTVPEGLVLTTGNDPMIVELGPGEDFDDADFGYFADVDGCGACDGKVTQLTMRYTGEEDAVLVEVYADKGGDLLYSGVHNSGDVFSFMGTDKKGTMGPKINFFIDGQLHTSLHTSCSEPIGPGTTAGDFTVLAGRSRNGGALCPVDGGGGDPRPPCSDCDGKVTTLTLEYQGAMPALVEVYADKGGGTRFLGVVNPGETFSFAGADKKGTLGPMIDILVNGSFHTDIHTSCSQPIGPGLVAGDFEVVDGSSRNGGNLCPL